MKTRYIVLLSALAGTHSGCYVKNAIDTPDTKAAVKTKPQIAIVEASADDLIKPWPMEQLPKSVSELQRRTYTEFSNTLSFGIGRMDRGPMGHTIPSPSDRYLISGAMLDFNDGRKWKITNLQLLGVQRNPQGHVYDVSKPKPVVVPAPGSDQQQAIQTVLLTDLMKITSATRPLDPFEFEALAKIREGNQLAVKVDGEKMKVLGAIRAVGITCINCHNVEKSHLLGAFSYELQRVQ
jgi:hypothetical protein